MRSSGDSKQPELETIMSATSGIQPILTYNAADDKGKVQQLIDLIPNPDGGQGGTGVRPGGQAGQKGGFLDEMSPAACAQILVELTALKAAIT